MLVLKRVLPPTMHFSNMGHFNSIRAHTHVTEMHEKEALPVISNHTGTSEDSVATTPTMCATGSLSITEKVKGDSSKSRGAASAGNFGLGIHSMWRRQVEDFWGRPLSTALIWERGGMKDVTQCYVTFRCNWVSVRLSVGSSAWNSSEVHMRGVCFDSCSLMLKEKMHQ